MMPGEWIPFMMPGDWRAVIVLSERDRLDCEPRQWMEWRLGRALGLMPFKVSSSAHLRPLRCLVTRRLAVRAPCVLNRGCNGEAPATFASSTAHVSVLILFAVLLFRPMMSCARYARYRAKSKLGPTCVF